MNLSKYGIKNNELFNVALTHTSYANENGGESYERLEYLGDAVLQLILSEYFYKNTDYDEGDMSKIRASYVCEGALFAYSKDIDIIKDIKLGHGLENQINETIVADVFESIVAAIYLTNGYDKVKNFVLNLVIPYIKKDIVFLSDYKSYFQELVQTDRNTVNYNVVKETGPSHDRTYEVEVMINDIVYGKGRGKSKKEAEQNAAHDAIKKKAGE
ncbi:MAG: ribonuclease III [Bacilli bacterium]|nr:ribonuclease III [Bacilli bacterium]MDD4408049.1 ribonuclease III [Bacilli bacterium]